MKKRTFKAAAAVLLFSLMISACGRSYSSANSSSASYASEDYAEEYGAPMEAAATEEWEAVEPAEYQEEAKSESAAYTAEQDTGEITLTNDKLVYTCNMEIETTEYADTVAAIREKIRQYGAIIEYESESDSDRYWYYEDSRKTSGTMRLSLTIRVPVAKYDAFVSDAGTLGKLISKSQNVDNISREYHSTEARIEALTKEEKRLNEMMDAAQTIEEMIYIEQRLTEVEYELNQKKTSLASMDVDVAYSTINMNVKEVLVYKDDPKPTITFGQRVKQAFRDSWESFTGFCEGLLILLIHLLPFLAAALVIALAVILARKAADKADPGRAERRKAAKAAKAAAKQERRERKAAMKNVRRYGKPEQGRGTAQSPESQENRQ